MRKRLMPVVAATAAMATFAPTIGAVSADSFGNGPGDEGWRPDNKDHDWCFTASWLGNWSSTANARHSYLSSATTFDGGTNDACGPGIDVQWATLNTTAWRGSYNCISLSGDICDTATLIISTNESTLPANERGKTMCHELGHSTGLRHGGSSDCMLSGNSTLTNYDSHHISHIDAQLRTSK